MNEWDKYREELERSKHDYCLYGPASLKLTLTPIIEDFNLPLDENSYWIAQHWQAMPSSPFGGIPRTWKLASTLQTPAQDGDVPPSGGSLEIGKELEKKLEKKLEAN